MKKNDWVLIESNSPFVNEKAKILFINKKDICTLSIISKNKWIKIHKNNLKKIPIGDYNYRHRLETYNPEDDSDTYFATKIFCDNISDIMEFEDSSAFTSILLKQILNTKIDPNMKIHTETPLQMVLSAWMNENGKFKELLPSHIRIIILKYLLDNCAGALDTIPSYITGPNMYTSIVMGFRGCSRYDAVRIALESGIDSDLAAWNTYRMHISDDITLSLRNHLLSIILPYIEDTQICVICQDSKFSYQMDCCFTETSSNRICPDCHKNLDTCPFCRKWRGMLISPIKKSFITSLQQI